METTVSSTKTKCKVLTLLEIVVVNEVEETSPKKSNTFKVEEKEFNKFLLDGAVSISKLPYEYQQKILNKEPFEIKVPTYTIYKFYNNKDE